ncbi:unnamed protein product, partial [Phaeothamnion confervicola]
QALNAGDPRLALAILHFALLDTSPLVARHLVERGYGLASLADFRFVTVTFRLLRDEFEMGAPGMTPEQFLTQGFGERKMMLLCGVLTAVTRQHQRLVASERAGRLRMT